MGSHINQPSHDEIEELFRKVILPFYHIKREISVPTGDMHAENDAEHSWSLAFLACALAPKIDTALDVGLVAQFALAHDIIEVYSGDSYKFSGDMQLTKAEREEKAVQQIAREFPHFSWIIDTIEHYERRDTDEAKFVYSLDKYIPTLYDYLGRGHDLRKLKITREQYAIILAEQREKAQTHPIVGKYYDEIRTLIEAKPEYFYSAE